MSRFTRHERLLGGTAMAASAGAAALAGGGYAPLAALCAGAATFVVGVDFLVRRATRPSPQRAHVDKFLQSRRLAVYEPDTGLFAHWYMELRGKEECDRATRYDHGLALLVIEPAKPNDDARNHKRLRAWFGENLRSTDIAGFLGNGRYIIVMPEATEDGARTLVHRMIDAGYAADAGVACYPADGSTFEGLYRSAATQLPITLRQVA